MSNVVFILFFLFLFISLFIIRPQFFPILYIFLGDFLWKKCFVSTLDRVEPCEASYRETSYILCTSCCLCCLVLLKGHGNERDFLWFLHKPVRHRSITLRFDPFRFWLRIRGDIRNGKTTPRFAESMRNQFLQKSQKIRLIAMSL